jgi:hypothetical protein
MNSFVVQAVTHALLDLASNPEYLKPLREEVEEVTKREGWTKAALDQMHKLDSFVKESQRLHPAGVCELVRFDSNFLNSYFVFEVLMGRCALLIILSRMAPLFQPVRPRRFFQQRTP